MFLQLFHVCADEHLSELDKIAVLFVVDFDDTPRVATTAYFPALWSLDFAVRTYNSKGDFGHDLIVLRNRLFVIQFIAWTFEDVDVVMIDICQNLWNKD